tara:strand:+ start:2182 stop:2625 length:444 start_codon:yes stop_codon:yes gene_type:complete
MSEPKKLTKEDLQFLFTPKKKKNVSVEITSAMLETRRKKKFLRSIEEELALNVDAQEILQARKEVKVKISQIKTSLKPDNPNNICAKIEKLEQKLAEANMINENPAEILNLLHEEVSAHNDALIDVYKTMDNSITVNQNLQSEENNS